MDDLVPSMVAWSGNVTNQAGDEEQISSAAKDRDPLVTQEPTNDLEVSILPSTALQATQFPPKQQVRIGSEKMSTSVTQGLADGDMVEHYSPREIESMNLQSRCVEYSHRKSVLSEDFGRYQVILIFQARLMETAISCADVLKTFSNSALSAAQIKNYVSTGNLRSCDELANSFCVKRRGDTGDSLGDNWVMETHPVVPK